MSNENERDLLENDQEGGNGQLTWDDFPMLVQMDTLSFLDQRSLNQMKLTSKYTLWLINYEYGLRLKFPTLSERSPASADYKIIEKLVKGMEGKSIRILEIEQMPPTLALGNLEKLIQYPVKLKHVSMKFVDMAFISKLLRHGRWISTFEYKIGCFKLPTEQPQQPSIVSRMVAKLIAGGYLLLPNPKPSVNEEFMNIVNGLPSASMTLENLSTFSLSMEGMRTLDTHICDWANCLHLLLTLPSASVVNLKEFKFLFSSEDLVFAKDILQILACVLNFVLSCPTLEKFSYRSRSRYVENINEDPLIDWGGNVIQRRNGPTRLPQNVIQFLIQKYGSDQLKAVEALATFVRPSQRMIEAISEMINQLKANSSLQTLDLTLFSGLETVPMVYLAHHLPSLRKLNIADHSFDSFDAPINDELYNFMLKNERKENSRYPEADRFPLWKSIETFIYHCSCAVGQPHVQVATVSLTQRLRRMRALKHLEVKPYHYTRTITEEPQADFVIESPAPIDEFLYENLQVLKLEDATMLSRDIEKLKMFKNLIELSLKLVRPYYAALGLNYTVQSKDLFTILTQLRKLNRVKVTMLQFPLDDQRLADKQNEAINLVGSVKKMIMPNNGFYEFNFCG